MSKAKSFERGLVVGKFSPLHRGHELVIRRAFEMCREVVIISYSNPELPDCDAARREKWLAELFPTARRLVVTDEWLHERFSGGNGWARVPANDVDETVHRRFTGFLCLRGLGLMVDAVFTSEDYGDGFARELTEYFRQHDRSAPEVRHVLVDRERKELPISGTLLRADIEGNRQWLPDRVYASFVRRVCILGGESSGKSTLAAFLAKQFGTVHVPEYGRDLWEMRNGALTFEDMLHIGETQAAAEEEAARKARRFLFCDTSPLTTLFYSRHLFQRADAKLELLAGRPYNVVVLCGADFEFVQDGTRQGANFRKQQDDWYVAELTRRGIPFLRVTGGITQRTAQVAARLESP